MINLSLLDRIALNRSRSRQLEATVADRIYSGPLHAATRP